MERTRSRPRRQAREAFPDEAGVCSRNCNDRYEPAPRSMLMSDAVVYSRARVVQNYQRYVNDTDMQQACEQQEVQRLKRRDREVRQHEQTHAAALGPYAGAIRYKYKAGPDGRMYAVGGSIQVRMNFGGSSPAARYHRAARIRRAAMGVGAPSSADVAVAVSAARMQHDAMTQRLHSD
jgi:hypothetical protein